MTESMKVEALRALLEDDGSEDYSTLCVYLELARGKVLNRMYPFRTDYDGLKVPDRYAPIQLKIAAYLMNKRGAEGEIQHIENGVHRNYGDADVPESMLMDIVPYAQAMR